MSLLIAMIEASDAADGALATPPVHHTAWEIVQTTILLTLVVGFTIWVFVRAFQRSEEPWLLIFKWAMTMALGCIMWFVLGPIVRRGGYSAMAAMLFVMTCGWCLAFVWRRSLATMIANPFGDLYDGGDQTVEAKPFYSPALTKRKRGNYIGAVADIRKELTKFPNDFEGQLLLAEIQAENLNDLPGAAIIIHRICDQSEHSHGSVAMALNHLADWYLKYHQDRDAAREALEKIIELLPDSEMSARAAQRIGHLASTEHLLGPHDRKKLTLVGGVQNMGLIDPSLHPKPVEEDLGKQAGDLVAHLHSHPLDTEARERLALLYANHYNRLDLAADQLEQLITQPHQPAKLVVHWLNVLADLQIRHGTDYETVRGTLQRVIDLYPKSPAAEVAASRIVHLKLELKAKEPTRSVKLGTYEQDIGLRQRGTR